MINHDALNTVYGTNCLPYIDKQIGFCALSRRPLSEEVTQQLSGQQVATLNTLVKRRGNDTTLDGTWRDNHTIRLWNHNVNNRKIGLVLDSYEDGGIYIAILGNEYFEGYDSTTNDINMEGVVNIEYDLDLNGISYSQKGGYNTYPIVGNYYPINGIIVNQGSPSLGLDELLDFKLDLSTSNVNNDISENYRFERGQGGYITNNKETTVKFGYGYTNVDLNMWGYKRYNPLLNIEGNRYALATKYLSEVRGSMPGEFTTIQLLNSWEMNFSSPIESFNFVSIPFNLLLTNSESQALQYLEDGTLPSDAFLFPQDWDNLPKYDEIPSDDDDSDDGNTPKDNTRGGDPNPIKTPAFVPSMFNGNNLFWLNASEFQGFINWFWGLGDIQNIDDILQKIQGLYNNLSEAVIGVRYYPVELDWIGGAGIPSNIIVGTLEKEGTYTTINKMQKPQPRSLGTVTIKPKYSSFLDLPPYSSLSLYLPYYGFVDLDMDILNGYQIKIYVVYDYLSLTIQYFVYYIDKNGEHLINSFLAKMGVNLPLTLQTKNDRDNAVMQNVSSAIGGLIGAGTTLVSGNPLGLLAAVNSISGSTASAPINARGMMGEQGALYTPSHPALIIRRPTIAKPTNFDIRIGYNSYTYTNFNNTKLKGKNTIVQVKNPRVNFGGDVKPTKNEIEQIYQYMERGVIV